MTRKTVIASMLTATALLTPASALAAPFTQAPRAITKIIGRNPAQTRYYQAFMARHHLLRRAPVAGAVGLGRPELGSPFRLPSLSQTGLVEPAPFFSVPVELTAPANAAPTSSLLYLISVNCTSPGDCVAVGLYGDVTENLKPMIFTETNGVWGHGVEATPPANAAQGSEPFSSDVELIGLTCTSYGNCVAVGQYTDTSGNTEGMAISETDGVWGQGVELAPPANAATASNSQFVFLNYVSCTGPGNCAVTGGYEDTAGRWQGLVISETSGSWAQGVDIALPPNASPDPEAGPHNPAAGVVSMGQVSCYSPGNCVAGGQYTDTNYNSQPMIATETHGVWLPATELALPTNATVGEAAQNGFLSGEACFSHGNCVTGGGYNDQNGNAEPVVFNETNGVWGRGVELKLPANAATAPETQSAYVNGLNCTSAGNCAVFSAYNDLNGNGEPLAITESGGVWAQGIEPPLPANAATAPETQDSNINGMSCAGHGACVAVGEYTDAGGFQQPMAYATAPTLSIAPTSLPAATVGSSYAVRLTAIGGSGSKAWSGVGSLPPGLKLHASTGVISGTPTKRGTFSFTATVSSAGPPGQQASAQLTIRVHS